MARASHASRDVIADSNRRLPAGVTLMTRLRPSVGSAAARTSPARLSAASVCVIAWWVTCLRKYIARCSRDKPGSRPRRNGSQGWRSRARTASSSLTAVSADPRANEKRKFTLYTVDNPKKRAVGFKVSDGMAVPEELAKRAVGTWDVTGSHPYLPGRTLI